MRSLRAHQEKAVLLLRQSLGRGKRRPLLQAPTGAGKTLLAAHLIDGALRKGKRVVFVVPAIELIDQTVKAFWDEGITDIGVIQASHPMTNPARTVQVASVQTLTRRQLPTADLVIVDEAHNMFDIIPKWMAEAPDVPFVGLSATPWSKGIGKVFDDLLIATTTEELIREGYLSPFRVFAPSHPDLSEVRTLAGDYREDDLSKAMIPLTADVVATWLARGENRPTLCFAVDRAHAKNLEQRFLAAGVATGYVDGNTPKHERDQVRMAFQAGVTKVVCNVGVLTTGVDWDVRCIILARPTKSEKLFVQIVGRGLRTAEGKSDCLILDHSDTTMKLGFVTDIHHDHLDEGKAVKAKAREREELLPRECSKCSCLRPPKVAKCPGCGHEGKFTGFGINVKAGELSEVDRKGKSKTATMEEKVKFISELKAYARDKNYSEGWVAHKFRTKFSVWPNDPRLKYAAAASGVGKATSAWIWSQNIRRAKEREAHAPHPAG